MLLQAETDALAGGVASDFRTQALADQWAAHCTFYNGCGPTETTIVNTLHRHEPGALLTIGRPTPNNTVYVLDEQGARL